MPRKFKVNWQDQNIKNLFKIHGNAELARLLKVSKERVRRVRISLKIPLPPDKMQKAICLLGQLSDKEISQKFNVYPSSISRIRRKLKIPKKFNPAHKGINWDLQPLGKIPDTKIAKNLNVGYTAVCFQRNKRNIPPAPISARAPSKSKGVVINWDLQPLGIISDNQLAKILNVSKATVNFQRNKRNIPVYFSKFTSWRLNGKKQ